MISVSIGDAMQLAARLEQSGRAPEAEEIYRTILRQSPGHAEALLALAVLHLRSGRGEYETLFAECIALQPDNPKLYCDIASAFQSAGRLDQAIGAYQRAIALRPGLLAARNSLGFAWVLAGQFDRAVAEFRASASIWPDVAAVQSNLGQALDDNAEFAAAAECFRRAIALKPDLAEAHVNLALNLLRDPEPDGFAAGWAEYEWRWRVAGYCAFRPPIQQPRWDGAPAPRGGATILLHAEQGLGDSIMFFRYVPKVIQRGWRVIVECQAPLGRLLRQSGEPLAGLSILERSTEHPGESGWPASDVHLPLMSLPCCLRETGPWWPGVYVRADPEQARTWSDRLNRALAHNADERGGQPVGGAAQRAAAGEQRKLRVGLVWAGSPLHRADRERSIAPRLLAPLADCPADFISVQTGAAAASAGRGDLPMHITDLSSEMRDMADTAALLESIDLLITVDTAAAHLAGAMGRPCWLLLGISPDFRWMLARSDSPWYPSLRLYRQSRRGDWSDPLAAIAADLRELARGHLR